MANPRPTPKPENLRPPWPPGTGGNPAGYSRGRRISDAIERLIEEMALDREFGTTAIAMANGQEILPWHRRISYEPNAREGSASEPSLAASGSYVQGCETFLPG